MYADNNWQEKVPQLAAYHSIIDCCSEQGLQIFVILTHLDKYHINYDNCSASAISTSERTSTLSYENKTRSNSIRNPIVITPDSTKEATDERVKSSDTLTSLDELMKTGDNEGEENGRLGEDILGELKGIYLQLSQRYILLNSAMFIYN